MRRKGSIIAAAFLLGVIVCLLVARACRKRTRKLVHPKLLDVPCKEPLVVLVPHRDREAFMAYLVPQLCRYLRATHPCALVRVLCVEQTNPGPYAKGISWNVGLRYLEQEGYGPNTSLVLNDADILPRNRVSYACPPGRKGVLWFQNTGGLKIRLGSMLQARGFPMAVTGWGYEDVAMWRRLELLAGVSLIHWVDEIKATSLTPAVVLNLEWETMTEEEAEGARKWYWGEDRKWVRMVQQSDRRWGVQNDAQAVIRAPSKEGWYLEAKRRRNEALNRRIEQLPLEKFRALAEADGTLVLRLQGLRAEPFARRFPHAREIPEGAEAWNLCFDSSKVLGSTPKIFLDEPELSWYLDGPTECQTNESHCGRLQSCKGGTCMPE